MSEVRPVNLETPQKQQQFIDPKTGTLSTYGHHVLTALFDRTGGFDDDVWRALGLGFTNLSQQANAVRRLEDLEIAAQNISAQIGGLRGDPRLATAERAEGIADDALFIAMSRAPADVVRRVEELERLVAFLNTATNQIRSTVQQQQRAANEAATDAGIRNAFDTQRWAALARMTDEAIQAVQDELDEAAADFDDSVRAALSASSPLTYDGGTGVFGANASLTSLGGLSVIADRFAYGTGANTWALGTITTFGRGLLDDADATAGRSTLGLGSLATASTINNGDWSGADLDIANGGTGASSAGAARTNLGLGTMATQDATSVAVTGGTAFGVSGVQITSNTTTGAGSGLELLGGASGVVQAYNRTGAAYIQLTLDGSQLNLRTSGTSRLVVSSTGANVASGDLTLSSAGKIGYATGSGGTVTQITSKVTGVTLNKTNGAVTLHNAAMAANGSASFVLTNSTIAATDTVLVAIKSGATLNAYNVQVEAVGAGSCTISIFNRSAGSLSEAVVLNFAVIKAVTS